MKAKLCAILIVLVSAMAVLGGCGSSKDAKASDASSKSNTQNTQASTTDSKSDSDLIAAAKKEGTVNVYSITSRISDAGKAFEKKYGIKVQATDLSDYQLIDKITKEAKANAAGADFVIAQDSGRVYGELIKPGYLVNYVPDSVKNTIPKEYQSPLVFSFMNKVLIYNSETNTLPPINNIWALTDAKWKGKFFFKNPFQEGINSNLTMLTSPDVAKKLEGAYERYYGKKITLTTKNAGYEWIKMAYQNGLVSPTSDTQMSESLGVKGQKLNDIGLCTFSKLRYCSTKNLALLPLTGMDPFAGFYYPTYLQMCKNAKHPNAAKLFIQYLLTDEGFKPWQQDMGTYSSVSTIRQAAGDMPFEAWSKILVGEDAQYLFNNRADVEDFLNKYITKK